MYIKTIERNPTEIELSLDTSILKHERTCNMHTHLRRMKLLLDNKLSSTLKIVDKPQIEEYS